MAKQIFTNGASALLATSISDSDLAIHVATGYGALFPNPGAGQYCLITLVNAAGDREVVKITSRTTDILTVPTGGRGQEGTSAASWTAGQTRVECRLTKGTLEQFIQRGGDQMAGNLDMDDNELQNAVLHDALITGGQTVGTPMRGVEDDSSNEIDVPDDGTRATAGGVKILVETDVEEIASAAFFVGFITDFFGVAADIPDGWHLCNGSAGTPDLRGLFVRGASSDAEVVAAAAGAATATPVTGAAGGLAEDVSGSTVLDATQIPNHTHRLWVWDAGSNGPGQMENFGSSTLGNAKGVAGNADSNTYQYRKTTQDGHDLIEASSGGGDAGHTHTLPAVDNHTHTIAAVPIIPPSKFLYKIMFIGFA